MQRSFRAGVMGSSAPVENAPTRNVVKAKSAVPMKFSLGGASGLDVLADGSPSSRRIDCATGEGTNEIEPTAPPEASGFQYDAISGRYSYVWRTSGSWAGTCRDLTITLDDGSTHRALFRLR